MHVELITRLFGGMALADRGAPMNTAHAGVSVCCVLSSRGRFPSYRDMKIRLC